MYWLRWTEKPFPEVAKFDQFYVRDKRSAAYVKKEIILALILLRKPSLNIFPQAIVYDDRVNLYWLRWTEKPFPEVAKFDQFYVRDERSAAYVKKEIILALILLRKPSLNIFPQAIVYDDRVNLYWLRWTEKPFPEVAKFDQFYVGNKCSAACLR